MCDLIQITVTLIHPENEAEAEAGAAIGMRGILSITSGGRDVPIEGDIDVQDVIDACQICGSRIIVARFSGTELTTCSNDRCASHTTDPGPEDTAAIRRELTDRIRNGEDYPR
jgi:hypothetical protein